MFYRKNEIEIRYNNEKLKYQKPEFFKRHILEILMNRKKSKKIDWTKKFEFKYGSKRRTASGYANIRKQHPQKRLALHYLGEIV